MCGRYGSIIYIHLTLRVPSHKSNPSSVAQGYVDSHSTLPWVMKEVVTGVEGYRDKG
jgi:hypothetical protein